jgi:nucleoside-diphosphate kinase
VTRNGFKLGRVKSMQLSTAQAQNFYGDKQPSQRAAELAQGPVLALEIIGAGVQEALVQASQSSSSSSASSGGNADARELGAALRQGHVHIASSERSAESELEFLFNNRDIGTTATFANCSLAIIRPHALQAGHAGAILDAILQDGFDVSALELFTLDKSAAEEFLEVYKGVLPEYYATVEQLTSGPLIAMEIRAPPRRLESHDAEGRPLNQSVVSAFRQLVGPGDPEVAKHIRPRTLRAVFGINKVKNAVHATDLEEDGVLESSYFFNILQQQIVPTTASMQAAMQRR